MTEAQLILPFDDGLLSLVQVQDLYERADQALLEKLSEDRRIERKTAGIRPNAIGDYFSMWANTVPDGGLIAMGVENDGRITGCNKLSQGQLNDLERTGAVYCPDARYISKRVPVKRSDGADDFVLLIHVRYREDKVVRAAAGDAFIRLGGSKHKLTEEEIRQLQIDKNEVDFESEPNNILYPNDFDLDLIRQFTAAFKASRGVTFDVSDEEILEQRHLGKRVGGRFKPNNACALLFAKDPLEKFPGCRIRFLRYDGEFEGTGEKYNVVKDIWIEGPVPKLIVGAEKVLETFIRDFSRLGKDGLFYTAPEYPKGAWYEVIVNACVHRAYSLRNMNIFIKMFDDHLSIESPGGFPPFVTPENIYDRHHPRNPKLMDAMIYLKFVKSVNEGTKRIRAEMEDSKLPHPEFEQKGSGNAIVRVTLRNDSKQRKTWIDSDASAIIGEAISKTLSKHELRVVNFAAEHGKVNVSQVQQLCGLTWPGAKKLLIKLDQRGILEHIRRKDRERDPQARFILKTGGQKDDKR